LSNRGDLIAALQQMSQPDPAAQEAAMAQQQAQMQLLAAQVQELQAKAARESAEAQKATVEAQIAPQVAQAKYIAALSNNLNEDNESKDFERRVKLADIALREKDIDSNERIALAQMETKRKETERFNTALGE
jgi:hypothetical protein